MNKTLAQLLGWSDLVELGGSLLGMPPASAPNCRGQALVPDWIGDWAACGPLLAEHGLDIDFWVLGVYVGSAYACYLDHASPDAALRHAVAKAVTGILQQSIDKQKQESK